MCLLVVTENGKELSLEFDGDFDVHHVQSLEEAVDYRANHRVDAILVNTPLGGNGHEEMLLSLGAERSLIPVILVGRDWTPSEIVRLAKLGAFQVLDADDPMSQLNQVVEEACQISALNHASECQEVTKKPWKRLLVGESWTMKVLGEAIRLVAPRRCTVLITGETGTGKELVARAIHQCSPRSQAPMVSINCSALPTELLEAELFGHAKGAFTGAFTSRVGHIERASRGTLFLDEIGDLPLHLQAKLLRVIQEREVQPLGTSTAVEVDIRFIAATNSNLEELVRQGKFRQDLYYRLNVAPMQLPPLRQRRSDVPLLANHFARKICTQEGLEEKNIAPDALRWLAEEDWPGNVRQLENAVEAAVALSGDRRTLTLAEFAPVMCSLGEAGMFAIPEDGIDYNTVVDQFERNILQHALDRCNGSKKKAAEFLRLKRTTFSAKLKSLSVDVSDDLDAECDDVALAHCA